MRGRFLIFASFAAILLGGCVNEFYMDPEPAPGFNYNGRIVPAVVSESDYCYIFSIDDNKIAHDFSSNTDVDLARTITYRQFQLSRGPHTMTIMYLRRQGRGYIRSGPVSFPFDVTAGHNYTIHSNGPMLFSGWHPQLLDDDTGKSARATIP